MQTKQFIAPTFNVKKKGDRTVTGYCSVYGNVDSVGDIVEPGAFRDSIAAFQSGRHRVKFLWNHDHTKPPTAKILNIREVSRHELPAPLRGKIDVTGALEVTRKYFEDPFSDGIFQRVKEDVITEMSFAYNILDSDPDTVNGQRVRRLKRLDMMDASDVNFGANPATIARVKNAMSYYVVRGPVPTAQSLKAEYERLQMFSLEMRLKEAEQQFERRQRLAQLKHRHSLLKADLHMMEIKARKDNPDLALELQYIRVVSKAEQALGKNRGARR